MAVRATTYHLSLCRAEQLHFTRIRLLGKLERVSACFALHVIFIVVVGIKRRVREEAGQLCIAFPRFSIGYRGLIIAIGIGLGWGENVKVRKELAILVRLFPFVIGAGILSALRQVSSIANNRENNKRWLGQLLREKKEWGVALTATYHVFRYNPQASRQYYRR